jgi:predicted amidohydrolase
MKSNVRVALAQYRAVRGNIEENIDLHKELCASAAIMGAEIIMFPELSLTGYEPDLLKELAIHSSSPLVQELSDTAVTNGLTIIVGCPLESGQLKPYIGAVILHPNGNVDYYLKQYLHQGESEYCIVGNENYSFSIDEIKFSLAICADFTEPQHYNDAKASKADVYLVSALISKSGFSYDSDLLSGIASKLDVPVLLSNFVGETGGWDTAGQSTVWDSNGEIVIQGSNSHEGITICTITTGKISDVKFQSLNR